ncbi:MAG TPA: hypothetical protein DEQ87_03445 [Algoriphagus sp.]|jgi:hypothetical protein|uniref:tetratricopeptide repeat protein n=1 Tax=unclassified Algoriphagus TaxID=2641541 RepID=UPI000C65954A|nr:MULTISPECIES: hypothetical protein [unclassified Algoriphagus]MAL12134.1 hypothetical protein [Algoriphagus sp.]MAN87016.1 hypothetical protein [Algoriphagus sp.]QYH40473.1 hypothetical protein GYM62_17330 [Algoriphagus sp. NBT04N3]HAS59653.1 hypothetical protein [Algoriphagus sp.]HAZ24501.1 hypothetical protein [Algoriphagus sp.]|tara:strand:+ start:5624 stop:6355 length:732 start_codon:yes stop_codon:yes gene_type:complete
MENNLKITPSEYELIEAWLDGKLTKEQSLAFQHSENEDPEWSLKIQEVKILKNDLEAYLFKVELEKIHEEIVNQKPTKSASLSRWILAIAASLILILVSWWGIQSVFQSPNEKLFAAYYQTDPGLITAMSGSDSYEFDRGMVDYKEGKYKEALARWNLLLEEEFADDTLIYFVAMANLELGNYDLSQKLLKQVADENASEFKEDASWYLALIYLKNGELDPAKLMLSNLDRPEAQALLKEIQN